MRRRVEAWERFSASSIPTESEEVWRYSGIDAFDLDAYAPASPSAHSGSALAVGRRLADSLGSRSALVVTYNGSIEAIEIDPSAPEALSVVAARTTSADSGPENLGTVGRPHDAFGELHDAFLADVAIVRVAAKAVVADPVIVVHLIEPAGPDGPGVAVFPHTLVDICAIVRGRDHRDHRSRHGGWGASGR